MVWMILVSYIAVGGLFMAVAQPLIERRVKPNDWYGVRTPKTKSNEDTWYKANEYGGRTMRTLGLATLMASMFLLPLGHRDAQTYALACTAVVFVGALWMAVLNLKYIAKL